MVAEPGHLVPVEMDPRTDDERLVGDLAPDLERDPLSVRVEAGRSAVHPPDIARQHRRLAGRRVEATVTMPASTRVPKD